MKDRRRFGKQLIRPKYVICVYQIINIKQYLDKFCVLDVIMSIETNKQVIFKAP
jgi:hypothetical protein